MEIDEIDLHDDQRSGFLEKYLSGQISFDEWLKCYSGDPDKPSEDGENVLLDENEHPEFNETSDAISQKNAVVGQSKVGESDNKHDDEDCPDSSSELFHPSIVRFPKKMTELLLMGQASQSAKSVDEFMDELPIIGKKRKRRRRMNELGREHRALMGKINMLYAKKQFDEAWNLCEELIQKVPRVPEPFQTLAFICEEKNDPVKAHQYKLIAAHLGSADCEEWIELGETSLKRGNPQEALICFNEASRKDPTNVDILMTKASIYENLKQQKKKMEVYENILKVLPNDGEKYFSHAKMVAQLYHSDKQPEKAIEVLYQAFKKYPDEIKYEDVNIFSELYMSLRQFNKAFQVLCQYCDVTFEDAEYCNSLVNAAEVLTEEDLVNEKISDFTFEVGVETPVDIRTKIAVCLIHCKAKADKIQEIISPIFMEPIEEVGDLYLDISEAYFETGCYEEALVLLDPLVNTVHFGQAAVWLKKAECLSILERDEEAASAYSMVVALAPNHIEARFTLSTLYQRLGYYEKALSVLEANDDKDDYGFDIEENDRDISLTEKKPDFGQLSTQEVRLAYHRCLLLHSQNKFDEFLCDGLKLLAHYMADVYHDEDLLSGRPSRNYRMALARMKRICEDIPEELRAQGGMYADIKREDWWNLLLQVARVLHSASRLSELEHIIKCAMSALQFSGIKIYQRELDFLGVTASYCNGNLSAAFDVLRVVLIRDTNCIHLWNMFARLMVGNGDSKHQKFCLRLLLKNPENFALQIINGHNALSSGNYRYALGEYARAFRQKPLDPMVSLLMGLSFIQMACQKFQYCRNASIVQGFLFLYQYEGLRGRCQETDFNLGRSYHQIGLLNFASHYYRRVLNYPMIENGDKSEMFWDKNNLHREAAFNLSLIYRTSGNNQVAKDLLRKYCLF
ncbi:general transcription factor 3C polypeptide 3-like isoform X1 [Xenia sp. Carnegie-2017]|uniref:general transcription factor 3C polypeptide 3-like isoform X1 n=1 Tax=Xenia sp. Carnegie-2017 TaxID=2897299 RepID=UPI001F04CDD9|nr:general transcription factor 3C polypeptide 3-like isoform X1 [Xenia sp. Carnegie-2017]XP_046844558.1 general transcription factor 3C polypeptide 3-like isoform X1 [Xenia sp. Carnegie-2017]XP_046844625.1 general transcription factor 3C polypeptide 3-like isoform X1 [Xenia sp. Carnegie-2017]